MDLKEQIAKLIQDTSGDIKYGYSDMNAGHFKSQVIEPLASQINTLFQTHLEEQLEGLRVLKVTPELTRQYSHLETYNVGDYNAPIECKELEWHIPELLQAQLEDVKKQLRDIWREK